MTGFVTRFRGADHTQPPVGHQVMELVDLGQWWLMLGRNFHTIPAQKSSLLGSGEQNMGQEEHNLGQGGQIMGQGEQSGAANAKFLL